MKITCHFIGWQIADTIQLTIHHYQKFCQRIVYFDNFSTDLSRDIALELGCEVKLFGTAGVLDDQAYVDLKNNCWKGDDSDFVIVCDDDEILLYPPTSQGTIFHSQGYGIYSNESPKESWTEIMTGVIDDQYSKMVCFNPKEVKEIGYVYGCHGHQTKPKGRLIFGERIPLLHYANWGGPETRINRHRLYNQKKRGEANVRWNLAGHYQETEDHKRKWFQSQLEKSEILSFPGFTS